MIRSTGARSDIAPLRRRLGALFVLRLLLTCAVLATAVLAGHVVPGPAARLVHLATGYLLLTVATETLRQWRGSLGLPAVGATVLADGVFIAAVLVLTGGPASALSGLLYVHLIGVTLLASYRTGLKVAVWQSLLLAVSCFLPPSLTGGTTVSLRQTVFAVAAFLAVAIATAACSSLNERDLRRSRAGFQALAEMSGRLDDVQNPDEVVGILLRALTDTFVTPRAALALRSPAAVSVVDGGRLETTPLPPSQTVDAVVTECWATRRPVLRRRLDPRLDPVLANALPGARNVVVLPFTADGEPAGAVVVECRGRPGATISAAAVALLAQFTSQAALAHRNVRLLAEVKRLATIDGLTGLTNRHTFEATLQREVARAVRTGEDLSLLLIDVDHFKAVNDTHGHPTGDEVLRHVGRVLATHGRELDLPARYGGEEFVVILPGCPADEAVRVAERYRTAIAAGAPLPVTASVGLAAMHRNAVDPQGLIKAADDALYEAKAGGRNRTVAAADRLTAVA